MKRKKVHSVKGTGGNELGDNEKESKNLKFYISYENMKSEM